MSAGVAAKVTAEVTAEIVGRTKLDLSYSSGDP